MNYAAIGIRVHSGWGALVAVSAANGGVDIIERRRVVVIDPNAPGAAQPYHHAEKLGLPKAEKHIANCVAASQRFAVEAIREVVRDLNDRGHMVTGAAILLASGRPLPALSGILASHALIHTAEGEFFRRTFRDAFEQLRIPVIAFPERELATQAKAALGQSAASVQKRIEGLGRSIGPPWTKDQKSAALAAAIVLAGGSRRLPSAAAP